MSPAGGAFTLIELLVVVAIISLLVSILLPSLHKAKGLARQAVCMNNLHQTNLVFSLYQADHDGLFPWHATNPSAPNYQDYRWHHNMKREGYLENGDILWCPAGRVYDQRLTEHYYLWGLFDHGYSLGLVFDYGVSGLPRVQAQVAEIRDPAGTIVVLDTRITRDVPTDPMTEQGRYFCDCVHYIVSSWGAGVAVARHDGKCGVAWVDGHVSAVVQPDPNDDSSLYSPAALTDYTQDPNYWDRK
jgi:prepilin-type N-terminal cleavage/methylation domain-containing protein/prepilin-type processing-associated H-X9-DG protein